MFCTNISDITGHQMTI